MNKILRKLLALNLTVIMLLAMMVPAMAETYYYNTGKSEGYYRVTNKSGESFKIYESFRKSKTTTCLMVSGGKLHEAIGNYLRGDEISPIHNVNTSAASNVYYLNYKADARVGELPEELTDLQEGTGVYPTMYYESDSDLIYERLEPSLDDTSLKTAPKGQYVYKAETEYVFADDKSTNSTKNESIKVYYKNDPVEKTFADGEGWNYVLEANKEYFVAVDFINPFTDVAEEQYFFDPVKWAVTNGITTGTSATTFEPKKPCNRAEVVTFLWRTMGSPTPTTNIIPFSDVKAGSWYSNAVLWAVENGITNGTSATTFSPNKVCTRAEVVTFLKRAVESERFDGYSNSNPAKLGALKAEGTGYKFDSTNGQLMPVFDSITAYDQHGNALSDTVDTYGFYSKPSLYRDDKITSVPEIGQKYYSGFSIDLDNIGGWEFTTEDIKISIPGFECKVYSVTEREMGSYMTIIYEAVAVDTKPAEIIFDDVPAGKWYTDAVIWAVNNGVTTGTSESKFSPNNTCNRAQIVTFLYRALTK